MAYLRAKLAVALLSFVALNGCFKSVTYVEGGPDPRSKYIVGEIEVVSAFQASGKRFRIAAITRPPDPHNYEIVFDKAKVRNFGEAPWREDETPGDWITTDRTFMQLSSLFSNSTTELRGLENKNIVYRYRILKVCDAKIQSDKRKEIRNTGSGVIAVPKLITINQWIVEMPSCYDPSDTQFELASTDVPPEVKQEIEAAKLKSEAEEKEKRLHRERDQYVSRRKAEFFTQAKKIADHGNRNFSFSNDLEGQIKSGLCPIIAAQAKLLGVTTILVTRTKIKSEEHEGYTSETYESSVTLRTASGKETKYLYGLEDDKIVFAIKFLKLNNEGCFDVERSNFGGYTDNVLAEATVKTVRDLIERFMKEKAYDEATAKIPN